MKRLIISMLRRISRIFLGRGLGDFPAVKNVYNFLYSFLKPEGIIPVEVQGNKMYMDMSDPAISKELFMTGIHGKHETDLFKRIVKEGMTVVDVGAHVGIFTIKAAESVGDKGLVVAVEPDPSNLALLQHNIETYNLRNVKIIGKAALDKATKARLFLSNSHACNSLHYPHKDYIEVEADTLDNIVSELGLDHVDFIKIDAEGAEPEVLRGSERILSSPGVKLSVASYHDLPNGQRELASIVSYLKSRGFHTQVYKKQYVYAARGRSACSYLLSN